MLRKHIAAMYVKAALGERLLDNSLSIHKYEYLLDFKIFSPELK